MQMKSHEWIRIKSDLYNFHNKTVNEKLSEVYSDVYIFYINVKLLDYFLAWVLEEVIRMN